LGFFQQGLVPVPLPFPSWVGNPWACTISC
jgi:hypothetical protein